MKSVESSIKRKVGKDMKKYAVGINTGTHSIALIAYNDKFSWPKGNLTWQNMFGNNYEAPYFESTRKDACMQWIKKFIKENPYDPFNRKWNVVDWSNHPYGYPEKTTPVDPEPVFDEV